MGRQSAGRVSTRDGGRPASRAASVAAASVTSGKRMRSKRPPPATERIGDEPEELERSPTPQRPRKRVALEPPPRRRSSGSAAVSTCSVSPERRQNPPKRQRMDLVDQRNSHPKRQKMEQLDRGQKRSIREISPTLEYPSDAESDEDQDDEDFVNGKDVVRCTECGEEILPHEERYRTKCAHFVCGQNARAVAGFLKTRNPTLVDSLVHMKKHDGRGYRDIMKDLKESRLSGQKMKPEQKQLVIKAVQASMSRTKSVGKVEGLIMCNRRMFSKTMKKMEGWKKGKSRKVFDAELEKHTHGGTSSWVWSRHPRSKKWEIGVEKQRELETKDIVAQSRSVQGSDAKSLKGYSMINSGWEGTASGLNMLKGLGAHMVEDQPQDSNSDSSGSGSDSSSRQSSKSSDSSKSSSSSSKKKKKKDPKADMQSVRTKDTTKPAKARGSKDNGPPKDKGTQGRI